MSRDGDALTAKARAGAERAARPRARAPRRSSPPVGEGRKVAYHHGGLRRALLDAALALIARGGPEGFTLRAAAREAGVTAGAPYHHFADKEALLAGVAEEGFQILHAHLLAARDAARTAEERVRELAVAYVRFAVEHPSRFRLMMGRDAGIARRHRSLARAARAAYDVMRLAVEEHATDRSPGVVSEDLVLGSWAVVHGLAFLAIDGHLGPAPAWDSIEPAVRATLLRFARRPGEDMRTPIAVPRRRSAAG